MIERFIYGKKKKEVKEKIDYKFDKYVLVAALVILVDQLSKYAMIALLKSESIDIGFLHIKVIGNQGFAFGLTSGSNIINILVIMLFLGVIIRFLITQQKNIAPVVQVILYLMLGGGLSNVIDRIIRGSVVDFIGVGNFPVFNIADICIVVGWGLFVYSLIMYAVRKEESKIDYNEKKEVKWEI